MNRDKQVLERILKYISYIEDANFRLDGSLQTLEADNVYKLAVTNALAQIGELTKCLSEDYKQEISEQINWHGIKGLRNFVAHEYGNLDNQTLWITISDEIPKLKEFCCEEIEKFEEQEKPKKKSKGFEYGD